MTKEAYILWMCAGYGPADMSACHDRGAVYYEAHKTEIENNDPGYVVLPGITILRGGKEPETYQPR